MGSFYIGFLPDREAGATQLLVVARTCREAGGDVARVAPGNRVLVPAGRCRPPFRTAQMGPVAQSTFSGLSVGMDSYTVATLAETQLHVRC